jgi:oxygen-independent coproporphyrinogen-3 oxidase
MQLMSNFKLEFAAVEAKHGIDFKTYFADALEELKPFEAEGLITLGDTGIAATPTGTMIIRNLAMPFDAYLKKIPEAKRQFSKTV